MPASTRTPAPATARTTAPTPTRRPGPASAARTSASTTAPAPAPAPTPTTTPGSTRTPAPTPPGRETRPGGEGRAVARPGGGGRPVARPGGEAPAVAGAIARPVVSELRLSAYAGRRRAVHPLGPVTLFAGPSGSGKSTVLHAYEALARLGAGEPLGEVFPDPAAYVPDSARPDAEGRRGFSLGCTVDGPAGPVRLDLAVQAEPELRIVGERLTRHGRTLLTTALRDPGRTTVQAAWLTAGSTPVTRAPLPDDLLGTALLPLRVAGATAGQREVLAAAEQTVVGLRSLFPCAPEPAKMRAPVLAGEGRLLRDCANLAEVLHRTHNACPRRHQRLAAVATAGCAGPVTGIGVRELPGGTVQALLGRDARPATPLDRLGDGELRYLALALTLLTGPGVYAMDRIAEVPEAMQCLTLLTDDLDRGLDARQVGALLDLTADIAADGHMRLVGAVGEATAARARRMPGVAVVDLTP
ncbi:ATP-binding protein [Streptomyces sp. NPDC012421]|uniref:ATP-binding protein n=1 Tax=Streptomyces sp. NPDC012421 TaxID=3364832 RepID=UPI0036E7AE7B